MNKTILINEGQKKLILKESINDSFGEIIKGSYEFTKKIIKMSSEQMGMNLEFLLTWGASIGGFVGPLNDFIAGKFPELSDMELSLIITGVISLYYIDNKETVKKILGKIKEVGLYDEFGVLLKKSGELKSTFVDFITSLNITLHKVTNIMSYAFIIPIIPIIYESVNSGVISSSDYKEIALRLSSFGLLTVAGVLVRELFGKLIKRFSNHR